MDFLSSFATYDEEEECENKSKMNEKVTKTASRIGHCLPSDVTNTPSHDSRRSGTSLCSWLATATQREQNRTEMREMIAAIRSDRKRAEAERKRLAAAHEDLVGKRDAMLKKWEAERQAIMVGRGPQSFTKEMNIS